jgi:hypothetical protein
MMNQKKTKKSFLGLVARGLGMGAADVHFLKLGKMKVLKQCGSKSMDDF